MIDLTCVNGIGSIMICIHVEVMACFHERGFSLASWTSDSFLMSSSEVSQEERFKIRGMVTGNVLSSSFCKMYYYDHFAWQFAFSALSLQQAIHMQETHYGEHNIVAGEEQDSFQSCKSIRHIKIPCKFTWEEKSKKKHNPDLLRVESSRQSRSL